MRFFVRFLVASLTAFLVAVPLATAPAWAKQDRAGRVLSGKEAVLRRPATIVTKTLDPDQGCQVLLDTGKGDCAAVRTDGGDLVFTVEPLAPRDPVLVERAWAARVYAKSESVAYGWDLVLENPRPEVLTFANVTAKVADVTGHGKDEIVFGFRAAGTGGFLDFDVVVPDRDHGAVVAAHDRLAKGVVVVKRGRIVDYTAVYKRTDATCCPTWIARGAIRFRDGAFEVVDEWRIPTKRADIPPGNLG